jgi:colicin import membrane protein
MTMNAAASVGSPYRVPKRHDGFRSLTLAVGMHLLLFVFLWGGIRWQSSQPVGVEAEVWDMTTQQAAPPPPPAPEPEPEPEPVKQTPPPPPPPPEVVQPKPQEPDIALQRKKEKEKLEKERLAEEKRKEEDRKRKLEEEKKLEEKQLAEQKKKEKEEADKAKKLAEKKEADKLAKARDAEMRRITGAAAGATTGTAAKSTAPRIDNGYVAALKAKIQSNVSYTGGKQDVEGVFRITQLPTGEVISVRKIKSSGVPSYDAAVENAINKSSPLPKKKDGTVERELDIVFNLKDLP